MTIDPQRAQALFLAALELSDSADRRAMLDQECAGNADLRERVEDLLSAHDTTGGFGEEPSNQEIQPTVEFSERIQPTTIIAGRYKLVEPIGEGGMGTVWLAEQKEPVKRRVAIKLVKLGMDSRAVLARFEAERQALAMMDHPNIARVLDGGVTEQGRPYFAMELVRGIAITDYCDHTQLSIRERLALFIQVCSAVQHAHQKGIIHRDLKPSNILVTEHDGRPLVKVIDFGLAKALHGSHTLTDLSMNTSFGSVLGTPLYMAPEQLRTSALDIDTRADSYSLGVILYELLTGSTPIERERLKEAAWDEIRRIVQEEEPPRPSTRLSSSGSLPSLAARRHVEPAKLTRLVRGELDWIIMKALEKDRNRRYETASSLGQDLQRYLDNEPVQAAPPSRLYRLRKLARRHRGPVIAASLILLALVGGMIGTSWGMHRANLAKIDADLRRAEAVKQKTRAEDREQQAIAAVKRFRDAIADNPELKNSPQLEILRKTLLKEPLAFFKSLRDRLQADNETQPEALARLASAAFELGRLTEEIGDKQDSLRAFEEARAIQERLALENPSVTEFARELAASHYNIGVLQRDTGHPNALANCRRAVEILERLTRDYPSVPEFAGDLASCYHTIGLLQRTTGHPEDALAFYRRALEIRERLARDNPSVTQFARDLAGSFGDIANLQRMTGHPDDALAYYRRALEIFERLERENPSVTQFASDLAKIHCTIGLLQSETGQLAEGLASHCRALEIREQLARDNPSVTEFASDLAGSLEYLGILQMGIGQFDEALASNRRALEIHERLSRDNPTVTKFAFDLAGSHHNVGLVLRETGQLDEALESYRRALEIFERLARDNPTDIDIARDSAKSHNIIGVLQRETGQLDEAFASNRRALEIFERLARDNPSVVDFAIRLASCHNNLGILQRDTDHPNEALASYHRALEIQERLTRDNPSVTQYARDLAGSHLNIGNVQRATGHPVEALVSYRRALEIFERLTRDNPSVADFARELARCHSNIGVLQRETGQFDEAHASYSRAIEILERLARDDPSVTEFASALARSLENLGILQIDTGQFDEALASYRRALEILERLARDNPAVIGFAIRLANCHNNIGTLQRLTDHPDEALASHGRALEVQERLARDNPSVMEVARDIGASLNNMALIDLDAHRFAEARARLEEAIVWQRKAFDSDPRNPNCRQFLATHLTNLMTAYDGLNNPAGVADSQRQLAELQASDPRFAGLDARLAAIAGGETAKDNAERLMLAQRAYDMQRFVLAARLFGEALDDESTLAESRKTQHAYNASCAAALAAAGLGIDHPEPDNEAKIKLRAQSLAWLQSELATWTRLLESAHDEQRTAIAQALDHWQQDPDLASLRGIAIDSLPQPERPAWRQLWSDVAALLARAREARPAEAGNAQEAIPD